MLACAAGAAFAFYTDRHQISVTQLMPLDAALSAFLIYVAAALLPVPPAAAEPGIN